MPTIISFLQMKMILEKSSGNNNLNYIFKKIMDLLFCQVIGLAVTVVGLIIREESGDADIGVARSAYKLMLVGGAIIVIGLFGLIAVFKQNYYMALTVSEK